MKKQKFLKFFIKNNEKIKIMWYTLIVKTGENFYEKINNEKMIPRI